jgi:hypothetical protein
MRLRKSTCGMLLLGSQYGFAGTPCIEQKNISPEISEVYQSGDFRFFYTDNSKSKHLIPDQTDRNKNGIPDYIENMAIQANATAAALKHLGFKAPLTSERYKDVANTIDFVVHAAKYNGLAFESPVSIQNGTKQQQQCGLKINIRYNLENFPGTWSIVTHELFHLYQYGYTQFKNPWYLEGMTNWLERLIRKERGNKHLSRLPKTAAELEKNVFSVPYNNLWHRLGFLAPQNNGQLKLPNEILERRYINGEKVFKDDLFYGWFFSLKILQRLEAESMQISKQNNLPPYNWEESLQRSKNNNKVILKAIQQTMREMQMDKTPEQQAFLAIHTK